MTNLPESARLNWPHWQQALLIAMLVLVVGSRLTALLDVASVRGGLYDDVTTFGGVTSLEARAGTGFGRALNVAPGGPLAKAGVNEGDFLRFDDGLVGLKRHRAGSRLQFTLEQNGVRTQRHLIVEPMPDSLAERQRNFGFLLNGLAGIFSILIGGFILWRGWGNKTAMLLGAAVATLGYGGVELPPWAGSQGTALAMFFLTIVGGTFPFVLLPAFAMRLYEDNVGPLPRWHWQGFRVFAVLVALLTPILAWSIYRRFPIPVIGEVTKVWFSYALISFLAVMGHLIGGWRTSHAEARNRFAVMIFAIVTYYLAGLVTAVALALYGSFVPDQTIAIVNALMIGVVAPGLLAYAVLQQKLFDFGFAVNRTLVYATVSVLLLASFALIEWAIKHLIPKAWYGGSAYISAAIAVGLFLLFHRIHHFVEQIIERLFFHKWQINEAALKRFVAAAAHVEKPEALAGNFTAELARFSGGAAASLYSRTAEGNYASAAGETIDADDPALAALRAEQGPVVPAEVSSPIEAALALPMMHQAALAGFVLLGAKPTGEDYRPDEIEVLGWATRQVGLDLQAIRVRELEQTNLRLAARNQALAEIVTAAAQAKA